MLFVCFIITIYYCCLASYFYYFAQLRLQRNWEKAFFPLLIRCLIHRCKYYILEYWSQTTFALHKYFQVLHKPVSVS